MKKEPISKEEMQKLIDNDGKFYITTGKDWEHIFKTCFWYIGLYYLFYVPFAIIIQAPPEIAFNTVLLAPLFFFSGVYFEN